MDSEPKKAYCTPWSTRKARNMGMEWNMAYPALTMQPSTNTKISSLRWFVRVCTGPATGRITSAIP